MARNAQVDRTTKETGITVILELDGAGEWKLDTGVPFFDHMLSHIAKHGLFDLEITARGDTEIDDHHTVEDVGICLGQAFKQALGEAKGIRRYGNARIPMIESLADVALDFSMRPHFVWNVPTLKEKVGRFDSELAEEFFRAFSGNAGLDLHVNVIYGGNAHHTIEAIFKACAKALDMAVTVDPRVKGAPSTKGTL